MGLPRMPEYLIQLSYIGEPIRRLLQEKRARRRGELARIVEHLGGTIETVYFAPGERSAYAFVEMPDANSVMGATMLIRAKNAIRLPRRRSFSRQRPPFESKPMN